MAAVTASGTTAQPGSDTSLVDFPFVKQGPVRLYSLTDGERNGGRDSISKLEGETNHKTDSAVYQKLIPLRLEVAERNDSGTTYRVSYIGYRENPGFKYMWNSTAYRYRYSHRLDYETEPIRDDDVSRYVRMTPDLQVPRHSGFGVISVEANLNENHSYRLTLVPYYDEYWNGRFYLGSSLLSVTFLQERNEMRISGNALSFGLADVAWFLQTEGGRNWPFNPGSMFGPAAYIFHLAHAIPNLQALIPIYGKSLMLRTGINTDWYPKGSPGKVAFSVNGGLNLDLGVVDVFLGVQNQLAATSENATGLRYVLGLGTLRFVTENEAYFR